MKTKKFLFPVMAVVLVVALVGVGFAAWTIISPVTVDDVTGSFVSEKLCISKKLAIFAVSLFKRATVIYERTLYGRFIFPHTFL